MNNTTEASDSDWSMSIYGRIAITVVFSLILFIGIIGNVAVLLIVIFDKTMQTTVNLCLAVLALADLGVLTLLPILSFVALYDIDAGFIGRNFCLFLTFYDRGALVCSVLIFMFISLDRYVALCHPFKSLHHWKGWKIAVVLALIWLVSSLVSIPYCYISRFERVPTDVNKTKALCYFDFGDTWKKNYETAVSSLVFLFPVPVLCYLYGRMIHALHSTPLSEPRAHGSSTSLRRSRSQVIKMLISVLVLFVACNVPFRIYVLLYFYAYDVLYGPSVPQRNRVALNWTARLLTYVNNSANPIIYFTVSSNFRYAFRTLFFRKPTLRDDRSQFQSRQTDSATI